MHDRPRDSTGSLLAEVGRPPHPRAIGAVNWRGTWTHYVKEARRFLIVWQQTLVSPVITTLLFLAIFSLALGGDGRSIGNIPFDQFLAPGLIMMAIAQNAFANSSSSLMISKMQGNIVDLLMVPLTATELVVGYALSSLTRGLAVRAACAHGVAAS